MLKLVASAYLVGGTSNLRLVSGQGAHPDVWVVLRLASSLPVLETLH